MLWKSIVDELHRGGVGELTVRVLEANTGARRFYEAMDCVLDPAGTTVIIRGGAKLPEVRYRCKLSRST